MCDPTLCASAQTQEEMIANFYSVAINKIVGVANMGVAASHCNWPQVGEIKMEELTNILPCLH